MPPYRHVARHAPIPGVSRRRLLSGLVLGGAAVAGGPRPLAAQSGFYAVALGDDPWAAVLQRGRGQVVQFHAWAGDEATNAFIDWAGARLRVLHDITLRHVPLTDTTEAIARLQPPAPMPPPEPDAPSPGDAAIGVAPADAATAPAPADADAANAPLPIDLLWFNGPHILTPAQQAGLRRFAETLPNFQLVDTLGKPGTLVDFGTPVAGRAVPWRLSQAVLLYDSARVPHPPLSMLAMPDWARANPGRLTHPQPRDLLGATFLKQALYEMVPHPMVLTNPASAENFTLITAPLWEWYATLRPHLWQQGRRVPADAPAQGRLLQEGEVDLIISLNPGEASMAIAAGLLRDTIRSYVPTRGSIGHASFLGIPESAKQPEAAMLVADFLLSPEAQAQAQHPAVLGSPTVLDLARLSDADRQRFESLPAGVATLSNAALGASLPEPHPSWATRLAEEWERRRVGRGD